MSQLRIRTKGFDEIKLNVVSFMSPIFASTSSSQTASSEQHHPIRTQQPTIRFDVVFTSQKEFEAWQTFVRSIQLKLLKGKDPQEVALVTLYWPERDIVNWQGLIKEADGGAERFQWAPQTVVEVELTKGLVSQGTTLGFSYSSDFDSIFGGLGNVIRESAPNADRLLTTPLVRTDVNPYRPVNPLDVFAVNGNAPVAGSGGAGGSLDSLLGYIGGK